MDVRGPTAERGNQEEKKALMAAAFGQDDLVDMVCGAAGACLDGDSTCYDLIKPKCMGLMRLP